MKNVNEWTNAELMALPHRPNWEEDVICDSILVKPARTKHCSGYRNIIAIAIVDHQPICKLTTFSDVIHLGGIGSKSIKGVTIDYLPISGWMHLFTFKAKFIVGASLSSLEIFEERV